VKLPYQAPEGEIMVELADYTDEVLTAFTKRFSENFLGFIFPVLMQYPITASDRRFFANCNVLRTHIKKIINERKQGMTGGLAVGDQKDIISMLVEDKTYKDNLDAICDEVIVMFIAGTKTVQGTTTNFIGQWINNEELRENFFKEVNPLIEKVKNDFVKDFTFEMTDDLEYVKCAYYETMRLDTPFSISSTSTVTKPCTINKIQMEPGTAFFVNMEAMHKDPVEWQKPYEFIPERFMPDSEYFLRPDGKKRNPLAFTPFLGGQRVCLGKTFAEITLKFTLPMYTYFFDFEYVK